MLRANGPEIERLIREMKIANPQISYKQISELTRDLGEGLDFVSPRVLFDARNSEPITPTRLHALAHVLGVGVKQIVLEEQGDEAVSSRAVAPAHGVILNLNLPLELMQTETIRWLSALPSQTVQHFIDVAIALMSNAGIDSAALEGRSRRVLTDIAKGRLASQLDEVDAQKMFESTRNPEKEKRFEKNTRLIIEKAVQYLNSKDVPLQKPDQTFIDYFAEYCQKVSDTENQELWAQILAAKVQRPDGLSLRTLRLVQDINQDIAQRFVKFCGIILIVGGDHADGDHLSIRLDDTDKYLKWAGITFDDLLVLADYGLVSLGVRAFEVGVGDRFRYFRRSFQARKKLRFRANPLTAVGRELFKLAEPIESILYLDAVWKMLGDDVGPIQPPVQGNRNGLF